MTWMAQWSIDLTRGRANNITEKFLGVSPTENRRIYFDASPISYATADRNKTRFLLIHGTNDDIVDPPSPIGRLPSALTRAGIFVRRIIIPGAGHFWSSDPFENDPNGYGATAAPAAVAISRKRALKRTLWN